MANDKLVVGLVLAGAAGLGVYAWTRGRQETGASAGGAGSSGGDGGGYSYSSTDPFTGQPIDPTTGLPTTGTPAGPSFILQLPPDVANRIADDARHANDQSIQDQRASMARTEDNARLSNAIGASVATAAAVPFAVGGAIKYGPPLARAAGSAASALGRAVAGIAPRLATPGAGLTEFSAVTGAGAAVGIGGGLALGLGTVKLLDTNLPIVGRPFDAVARTGQAIGANTPGVVQSAIKTVALPLSLPGAVVTGLVGHGDPIKNLQSAYQGSFIDQGVRAVQGWFKW